MTPKITFERASPVYEGNLRKMPEYVMPDAAVYEAKIFMMQKEWEEWGPKIFATLAQITKLEWQEVDIECHVVSGTKASFSHPLTLKLYDSDEVMFDTFVHELMHRLLKNNPNSSESLKDARKKFMAPYENESIVTKNHIILHALHAELAQLLFGEERMKRIMDTAKNPDYIRAWDIVRERGQEVILKKCLATKV